MKAIHTKNPPCKMKKGEIRRVPQNPRNYAIGYHICCPKCGFSSIALAGKDGMEFVESGDGVSFSVPFQCPYCLVWVELVERVFNINIK